MSDDKVRKKVAKEMFNCRPRLMDSDEIKACLSRWIAILDPPAPPLEKPMRYWLHLAGTSRGYGVEIECRRQTAKPGIEWIEFHPADAPHCDKAEHEGPDFHFGPCPVPPASPNCDVEEHTKLAQKAFDLKCRVSELEEQIRKVQEAIR